MERRDHDGIEWVQPREAWDHGRRILEPVRRELCETLEPACGPVKMLTDSLRQGAAGLLHRAGAALGFVPGSSGGEMAVTVMSEVPQGEAHAS